MRALDTILVMEEDFASVICFVSITTGCFSMEEDHGGECGKEVITVQESFPRSILYRYDKGGIEDGVHKFGSWKNDSGVV